MSLQFVFGGSGSGKSTYVFDKIIKESIEQEKTNYIVLVPEQFTMQTQKELVSRHPCGGILNINVLSFERLAYHIFDEVGGDNRKVLEETGKTLVLRKLSGEYAQEMKILGSSMKKPGMIGQMKSIISEFTQYHIGPGELDEIIEASLHKPRLSQKLKDISVLYGAFRNYLKEEYITAEQLLDVLSGMIHKSSYFKNSVLVLDGFTGFTPVQMVLMEKFFTLSKKIYITITIDGKEELYQKGKEHELFYMSKQTIQGLLQLAKETNMEIEDAVVMKNNPLPRFASSQELGFLEQHLFRYDGMCFEEKPENIRIFQQKNPREEIHVIAREIKRLVREEQYHYDDIAVISGALDTYRSHVEELFTDCEIPYFMDHKRSLLYHPLIEFIRSFLEMLQLNFTYKGVFRFLRCGVLDFETEKIDNLENYVIALGVKGKSRWNKKFLRSYGELTQEDLAEIEETRLQFMDLAGETAELLLNKTATVRERTEGLYRLMVQLHMQEKMQKYAEYFQNEGNLAFAKEYEQIYGIVIQLMDKIVDLLGNEILSLKEYREILDAGFEEAKVGIIPPSRDRVVVGDMLRTRLSHVKVLFFAGMNDGIVPKNEGNGGVISEQEREFIQKGRYPIAPGEREKIYIQRFYLYLSLTKPEEKLYLSYSTSGSSGEALRPSYFISQIQHSFPKLKVESKGREEVPRLASVRDGIGELISRMGKLSKGEEDRVFEELYTWYFNHKEWKEKVETLIEAAFYSYTEKGLSKAVTHALYGKVLENSVSRLERFAACAFAHFMDYGLKLKERQEYSFEPVDMGTIFHNALELFSKKLEKSSYTWFDVPEQECKTLISESISETAADYGNTVLESTARNSYITNRIGRLMERTVWALTEQVKRGKFIPSRFELSFSMAGNLNAVNIALPDGEEMRLKGRIDRTDLYETEDKVYVKVIDYKSGIKQFDLLDTYYGLQLQLVTYMNAAVEMEAKEHKDKKAVPAGVFYYHIQDPVVDKNEQEDGPALQGRLLKELKMDGLVNSGEEAVNALDSSFQKDSDVIPVGRKKDGSYTQKSAVVSEKQFKILSDYVNWKIKELGSGILKGNTEASPFQLKGKSPCEYCPYGGVCGFDEKISGYHSRRLKKMDMEQVWEKLEKTPEEES